MYYYIINPSSGRGQINNIQERLRERLDRLGIAGEFAKTTGPSDATKMARAGIQKGFTTIVAVGGDSTVNEVLNGIDRDNIAVGIIPLGNTNLIAKNLGIHNWQAACTTLAARRLTSYGLIAAGQNFFLSTLQLGFETDLDKKVDTTNENLASRIIQFGQGIGHARNFTPLQCNIQVDDKYKLNCSLFSLSVANQKFSNPLAENKLIVRIFDKPSTPQLSSYLWQHLKKTPSEESYPTTRFTANRIVINTKPVTGITVDGKLAGRTPIAIRLTDRRIKFITEKASTGIRL